MTADLEQLIGDARRAALTLDPADVRSLNLVGIRDQARQVVNLLDERIAERRVAERGRPLADRLAAAGIPLGGFPMSSFVPPDQCPSGPHRGPEGPNEDLSQCATCWSPSYTMRREDETYGDHLPDCSLPVRHPGRCEPGGNGHPTAPVIRGYWPERCGNPEPHRPHEHYGKPAVLRRDCPGRRGDAGW